jgi:sulfur-carrier protein
MRVFVPSPLRSYTAGAAEVEAAGRTVGELLVDLDRRFPGLRFRMIDEQDRIRPHMRIFINGEQEFTLEREISSRDDIEILQALSGG